MFAILSEHYQAVSLRRLMLPSERIHRRPLLSRLEWKEIHINIMIRCGIAEHCRGLEVCGL